MGKQSIVFPASRGLSRRGKNERKERWRVFPKFARLWSSRHRFTLRRILHNIPAPSAEVSPANRFCGLCRTWEKLHWLLRKRQRMRNRKRVGSRQWSLSFLSFLPRRERPLLAGNPLLPANLYLSRRLNFITHNTPDSSCTGTKTVTDKDMASVHTYEHRTVILARFLQRSEVAPRWSRNWSVAYGIGSVLHFGTVWTGISWSE